MAARVALLFLLFCQGERSGVSEAAGLSEEDEDFRVISSKKQQVLPHPETMDFFSERMKEPGGRAQDAKSDVRYLPNVAFQLSDRMLSRPESSATSLTSKHSPELAVNRKKRSSLTNGEVEGVINGLSLVPRSEQVSAVQPELYVDTDAGDVQLERTRTSKWVAETQHRFSEPRPRRRRSWLWNQFFVIEEYRGPEPVLIGRVSLCHNQSACACESPASICMSLCLCFTPEGRQS